MPSARKAATKEHDQVLHASMVWAKREDTAEHLQLDSVSMWKALTAVAKGVASLAHVRSCKNLWPWENLIFRVPAVDKLSIPLCAKAVVGKKRKHCSVGLVANSSIPTQHVVPTRPAQ
jgi:hypothetical protein